MSKTNGPTSSPRHPPMGKLPSHASELFAHASSADDPPPKIPSRTRKERRGPALPEKPPHIRAKSESSQTTSTTTTIHPSQTTREPLRPNIGLHNLNSNVSCPRREVLVAATKSRRERPAEKRQREPARLLTPPSSLTVHHRRSSPDDERTASSRKESEQVPFRSRSEEMSSSKKWSLPDTRSSTTTLRSRRSPLHPLPPPLLLIPRNLLTWSSSSAPLSHALWSSRRDSGRSGVVRQGLAVRSSPSEISSASSVRPRSGSVARSGSLTSQGSSSSDSGGETSFPKSVLKKEQVRRNVVEAAAATSHLTVASMADHHHQHHQKKNVTFNAYATVQLMTDE